MTTDTTALDVSSIRGRFSALRRGMNGRPCVFADAPGGTQSPDEVIDALASYMRRSNANTGGAFATSAETDEVIASARCAGADLLGCDPAEVVFGPNMTTLAFALSRSLGRDLRAGDEVVVTKLDHDANVAPWRAAAEDAGAEVRWIDVHTNDCTLDLGSLADALSSRTRIVAFGLASNAVGTVTRVNDVVRAARRVGALVVADAVHLAPHRAIDVRSLDVDVLFCSPYKFFGPHLGLMYARRDLLDAWRPYKVRPSHDESPDRWETGTKNHEALAGLIGAIDYIASLSPEGGEHRRSHVLASMESVRGHEGRLTETFLEGAASIPGLRLYGIADPLRVEERTPTFAVRLHDLAPRALAEELGRRGVFVWDGNYYAIEIMERLGLEESGGAVRIGFCHYNTEDEVNRVLEELEHISSSPQS